MSMTVYVFFESLALSLALSADALAIGFSYGASKIKVPLRSALTIGTICAAVLAVALFTGNIVQQFLPSYIIKYGSFIILAALGLVKLADLENSNLNTDADNNKTISFSESVALAGGLSLDGLAAGFSAGMSAIDPIIAIFFTLIFTTAAIKLSSNTARRLFKTQPKGIRFFGLILIVLAVLKLF